MAFYGDVALITGAGRGMGALSARRLAGAGARVAAVDRDAGGIERLDDEFGNVHAFVCDVTDTAAVEDLLARVVSDLAGPDRVVNAAGILRTGSIEDMAADTILEVMAVNFGGTVNVVKAALPGMLERGRGDIVNFASLAGWIPAHGIAAYAASKHAVVAFTEVLAHEHLGTGLRVCCVCPPTVDTPLLDDVGPENATLTVQEPIAPEVVVDAVEASIEAGDIFSFPGRGTRSLQRVRRFTPAVIWKGAHRAHDAC